MPPLPPKHSSGQQNGSVPVTNPTRMQLEQSWRRKYSKTPRKRRKQANQPSPAQPSPAPDTHRSRVASERIQWLSSYIPTLPCHSSSTHSVPTYRTRHFFPRASSCLNHHGPRCCTRISKHAVLKSGSDPYHTEWHAAENLYVVYSVSEQRTNNETS